jgi:hypothetical protein
MALPLQGVLLVIPGCPGYVWCGQKRECPSRNPTILIANVQHHDLTGRVNDLDSCLKGGIPNADGCISVTASWALLREPKRSTRWWSNVIRPTPPPGKLTPDTKNQATVLSQTLHKVVPSAQWITSMLLCPARAATALLYGVSCTELGVQALPKFPGAANVKLLSLSGRLYSHSIVQFIACKLITFA